jgi:hypothetical protein
MPNLPRFLSTRTYIEDSHREQQFHFDSFIRIERHSDGHATLSPMVEQIRHEEFTSPYDFGAIRRESAKRVTALASEFRPLLPRATLLPCQSRDHLYCSTVAIVTRWRLVVTDTQHARPRIFQPFAMSRRGRRFVSGGRKFLAHALS